MNTSFKLTQLLIYEIPKSFHIPHLESAIKLKYQKRLTEMDSAISKTMEYSLCHRNCIFLVNASCIFRYNYADQGENCVTHRRFRYALSRWPDFFVLNADHSLAFIAVKQDVIFVDMAGD